MKYIFLISFFLLLSTQGRADPVINQSITSKLNQNYPVPHSCSTNSIVQRSAEINAKKESQDWDFLAADGQLFGEDMSVCYNTLLNMPGHQFYLFAKAWGYYMASFAKFYQAREVLSENLILNNRLKGLHYANIAQKALLDYNVTHEMNDDQVSKNAAQLQLDIDTLLEMYRKS